MRTYLVGRRNSKQPCDIELPAGETSVSRKHLELSLTDDGRCYLVHLHPKNRTRVRRGGGWQEITQEFVDLDEPLQIGYYETTARDLLSQVRESPAGPRLREDPMPAPPPRKSTPGTVVFNPSTGEFEER